MKRPNPLHPDKMSPAERRSELARILAGAIVRLHSAKIAQIPAETGDSSLHFPRKQSGTATPTQRRSV